MTSWYSLVGSSPCRQALAASLGGRGWVRNEAAMLPLIVDRLGLVDEEWGGSGISEFEGARLGKSEE